MMRSVEDLRTALAAREGLAPDPDGVLSDLKSASARPRRMRAVGILAGATLAVAAVVATPVLLAGPGGSSPAPVDPGPGASPAVDTHAADRPDLFYTVATGAAGGYQLWPAGVGPDVQMMDVLVAATGQRAAFLALYRPGSNVGIGGGFGGDPLVKPTAPTAEVNGVPAWFSGGPDGSWLSWDYAPDATAILGSVHGAGALPVQTLVALAESVTFVDPYPATVPFRLDYLPADLAPFNVSGGGDGAYAVVQFESDNEAYPRAIDITIVDNPPVPAADMWFDYPNWDWHPTTIAGRSARYTDLIDGRRCEVEFGAFVVSLGCSHLSPAELDQIVGGLHLAAVTDPASWFPLDQAIPGS
jgi:hypothetical protein